jgi:hypothetical protein
LTANCRNRVGITGRGISRAGGWDEAAVSGWCSPHLKMVHWPKQGVFQAVGAHRAASSCGSKLADSGDRSPGGAFDVAAFGAAHGWFGRLSWVISLAKK